MPLKFTPGRLTLARQLRGLTQAELGVLADLSAKSISSYEGGDTEPSWESLLKLARKLLVLPEFFSMPAPAELDVSRVSFRALTAMTARQRDSVLATGALAIELDGWIEERFERPAVSLPDLRGMKPEAAADALRAEWGLGLLAIGNLTNLLELHGVRLYSLAGESGAIGTREVDAFSFWWGDSPFIFLNPHKTSERSRFDAAHELGHLVLHRHGAPSGRPAEAEANSFASAFLMPKPQVIARAPRLATAAAVIEAKQHWGVSAMALTYRMNELGLLKDWHYRKLCIEFRSRFGSTEPNEMPRETSQLLGKVLAALRDDGFSRSIIARGMNLQVRDLETLFYGLVLTVVQGNPNAGPTTAPRARFLDVS